MDKEGNKITETLPQTLPNPQREFSFEDKFIFPIQNPSHPTEPNQTPDPEQNPNDLSEKKVLLLKQFLSNGSNEANEATGANKAIEVNEVNEVNEATRATEPAPKPLPQQDNLNISRLKQFSITLTPDPEQNLSLYKLKLNWIIFLLKSIKYTQCLIFFNDKGRGDQLLAELEESEMNKSCLYIHGEMSQEKRIRLMNKVKLRNSRVIISTDLLSRGIDIDGIDMVIN